MRQLKSEAIAPFRMLRVEPAPTLMIPAKVLGPDRRTVIAIGALSVAEGDSVKAPVTLMEREPVSCN